MKKIFVLFIIFTKVMISHAQSYNFEQGVKAYREGNTEKALDYFGREINDNPKSALALFYRAVIYNFEDQNAYALRDINNAIKCLTSKEKIMLAGAHKLRGDIYFKIENYEKTFEDYAVAIKLSPKDPDILIDRAQKYFELKQYSNADADYKKALEIDESLVVPYAGLGRNYINQKNYGDAEKILNKLIKLEPSYTDGYKFRARAFYEQKKYNEALEDIFYCFLLDETDKSIRNLLISYSEKNYSLALSKINAEISSNPEKDLWYFIRARLNEEKYNYTAAIADFSKVLELTDISYRSNLLSYRAKCYSNAGMYELSIADYTEAISIDSTNAYYYGYRGDVKRLMGNYIGARDDISKAIKIEPRESWFYYRRGWVEEEFLKNNEAGLNNYNEAIAIDKDFAYTYLHRGRLFETKLNNSIKAKEDYTKVIEIDTIILESGNCAQYALFHLGRIEEAIKWINKILEQYPTESNFYDATCLYSLMKKPSEALSKLKLAFQNGYRDFIHLSADDDLDNIRNLPEFKALVNEWKAIHEVSLKEAVPEKKESSDLISHSVTIPMKLSGSGTYEVPCIINDLKLNLIFDTGASDITISKTEAEFMLKNNYLSKNDITGTSSYMIANGDIEIGTTIIFRKVDFGGLILKNVKATVIENKNAPLLFGQSALSKYGKIIIDNEKKLITISTTNK